MSPEKWWKRKSRAVFALARAWLLRRTTENVCTGSSWAWASITTSFSCFFRRPGTVEPRKGQTRTTTHSRDSISQGMNLKRLASGDQWQSQGTHSGPLDLLSGRPRRGPDTYRCLGLPAGTCAQAHPSKRCPRPPCLRYRMRAEAASIRSRVRPPPMHPESEPHIRGGAIRCT